MKKKKVDYKKIAKDLKPKRDLLTDVHWWLEALAKEAEENGYFGGYAGEALDNLYWQMMVKLKQRMKKENILIEEK